MNDWRNIRTSLAALLLLPLLLAQPVYGGQTAADGAGTEITIVWNQEPLSLERPPEIRDSRVYLPLHDLAQAAQAELIWDSALRQVKFVYGDTSLRFVPEQPYGYVNGVITAWTETPYISQGRTMVPLRLLEQIPGIVVAWNGSLRQVLVTTETETETETGSQTEANPSAQEPEQEPEQAILTYEEAARLAVRNNDSYYDLQTALSRVEDTNDRLYLSPGSYDPSLIQTKDSLNLQEKWLEQQLGLLSQGMAVNMRSQINQLHMKQEELALLKDTLNTYTYVLEMETLKYDYGVISRTQWEDAQNRVASIKAQIAVCEAQLQSGFLQLSAALGDTVEADAAMEFQYSYAPVTEAELEEVLDTKVSSDPYLWYAQEEWKQKDYKLKTYDYMTDYYGGGLSYPVAELELDAASHNVARTRTRLQEAIAQRYVQLQEVENSIELQELTLQDAVRTADAVRLQYEVGMATKSDWMQAQMQIPSLIYQIRALQLQHATLRESFAQPWLQPSYVSAGAQ